VILNLFNLKLRQGTFLLYILDRFDKSFLMLQKTVILAALLVNLVQFLGSTAYSAQPFEEACQGHGLSIENGMCKCEALELFVNPWTPGIHLLCNVLTRTKDTCLDSTNVFPMKYMNRRCYCPVAREFLGDPIPKFVPTVEVDKTDEAIEFAQNNERELFSKIIGCQRKYYEQNLTPETKITGARSIQIHSIIPDVRGGSIYKVSRIPGKRWHDESDQTAPQGSPQIGTKILGPRLGMFFGFATIGDFAFIPSWDFLNARISEYNQAVARVSPNPEAHRILLSFYPATGLVSDEDFLRRFAYNGEVPISQVLEDGDETMLFHDTNIHTAKWFAVLNYMVRIAQAQARLVLEFRQYFKDHAPEKANLPQFKFYLEYLLFAQGNKLDAGSGNLAFMSYSDQIHSTPYHEMGPVLQGISEKSKRLLNNISAAPLLGRVQSNRDLMIKSAIRFLNLFPDEKDRTFMADYINEFDQIKLQEDPDYAVTYSLVELGATPALTQIRIDFFPSIIERVKAMELFLPVNH
jgi:hypothetical protein